MSGLEAWADAIAFGRDDDGRPTLATVINHIRGAIIDAGFVSHGRITSGLKEAYRPFAVDEDFIRDVNKEALRILLLSGDVDEFATIAGRGYAATPPRRITWGGKRTALLGAVPDGLSASIIRQVPASETLNPSIASANLIDELGRPAWRSALVELGGADAPDGNAAALYAYAQALAASGERFSLDEPEAVAVVSGRDDYFGRLESAPSGRWQRVGADGCYPAAIRAGHTTRYVVLHVSGKQATLWQPPSRDIWRWIVVGLTLAQGDPVLRYDFTTSTLEFLTPPPNQAERAALIAGVQRSAWSWEIDERAYAVIASLIESPQSLCAASPRTSWAS